MWKQLVVDKCVVVLLGFFLAGCIPVRSYSPLRTSDTILDDKQAIPIEKPVFHLIRIAIAIRQPAVHLIAPEAFILSGFPMDGTPVVEKGERRFRETTLTPDKLYAHKAYIKPLGEGQIEVNGKSYRGSIEIVEDQAGTLTVINEVSLEEYVMGVLAGEVPRNWPLEALKAQAIAARTFAVFTQNQARAKSERYDLENTAFFQMYQGSGLVNENIRTAVTQTEGEILTYNSMPIMAVFHSNCGGETSGSIDVWSHDQPYLKSVSCQFGNDGTHYRWEADVSTSDMARKLRAAGLKIADVIQVEPLDRDESNRIKELSIMDENGQSKKIKGSVFRMAIGPDVIRSTRFDVHVKQDRVVFNGKGWGHGVGLCQEGAYGMARDGYRAFDILRHYYYGVILERLKDK